MSLESSHYAYYDGTSEYTLVGDGEVQFDSKGYVSWEGYGGSWCGTVRGSGILTLEQATELSSFLNCVMIPYLMEKENETS